MKFIRLKLSRLCLSVSDYYGKLADDYLAESAVWLASIGDDDDYTLVRHRCEMSSRFTNKAKRANSRGSKWTARARALIAPYLADAGLS